jgi:hypothetical protein
MSCPHADTTTVAWLAGDADDAHVHHVAACAECQAVLVAHEQVGRAMRNLPRRVRVARSPVPPVWLFVPLVAAAAALLLWARLGAEPVDTGQMTAEVALPAPVHVDVDGALDELDADLDALATDLETL